MAGHDAQRALGRAAAFSGALRTARRRKARRLRLRVRKAGAQDRRPHGLCRCLEAALLCLGIQARPPQPRRSVRPAEGLRRRAGKSATVDRVGHAGNSHPHEFHQRDRRRTGHRAARSDVGRSAPAIAQLLHGVRRGAPAADSDAGERHRRSRRQILWHRRRLAPATRRAPRRTFHQQAGVLPVR